MFPLFDDLYCQSEVGGAMAQDLPIRYHGNRDTRRRGALNRFRLWTAALENETVRPVVAETAG